MHDAYRSHHRVHRGWGGDMMGRFLWILESVRLLSFVPSTFSTVVDFDTSLPQQYIGTTDSTRHLKGSDPLISEITIFWEFIGISQEKCLHMLNTFNIHSYEKSTHGQHKKHMYLPYVLFICLLNMCYTFDLHMWSIYSTHVKHMITKTHFYCYMYINI